MIRKATREKMRLAKLGKSPSQTTKDKISKTLKGHPAWNKGLTKETDSRVLNMASQKVGKPKTQTTTPEYREHLRKRWIGKKNPLWQGGVSFEKYGKEFNETLKWKIRKRDGFQCQSCGCSEIENGKGLDIHHIDYNKKNNTPTNLISLCVSCHSITNFERGDWIKHYQMKIEYKVVK